MKTRQISKYSYLRQGENSKEIYSPNEKRSNTNGRSLVDNIGVVLDLPKPNVESGAVVFLVKLMLMLVVRKNVLGTQECTERMGKERTLFSKITMCCIKTQQRATMVGRE